MQRFVKQTLLFASIVLLLFAAGEWYVESIPNPARDKHRWMTAHHDRVTTLVLGDSHAFYGIRPDLLGDSAYSLALVSQTLRYDDYLLRHYAMPHLRRVVLTMSYFTLWEDFERMPDSGAEIARYHIYMDCDLHRSPQYYLECMHQQSFVERLKSLYTPPRLTWDSLGWGSNYTLDRRPSPWDNGEERAAGNTYSDATVVDFNDAVLRRIIDFCRQRGVQLTLVATPVSATFRQHESPRQVEVNRRVLSSILRDYPEVQYLDYEADPRFGTDDFYDADHLSDVGAERLSRMLREEMLHEEMLRLHY